MAKREGRCRGVGVGDVPNQADGAAAQPAADDAARGRVAELVSAACGKALDLLVQVALLCADLSSAHGHARVPGEGACARYWADVAARRLRDIAGLVGDIGQKLEEVQSNE